MCSAWPRWLLQMGLLIVLLLSGSITPLRTLDPRPTMHRP